RHERLPGQAGEVRRAANPAARLGALPCRAKGREGRRGVAPGGIVANPEGAAPDCALLIRATAGSLVGANSFAYSGLVGRLNSPLQVRSAFPAAPLGTRCPSHPSFLAEKPLLPSAEA